MKTGSRTTAGQAKDAPPSPTPPAKAPRRGRHEARGSNRRRAIKKRSTAINNDRADNQARSPPHNIQATANSPIMVNKFSEKPHPPTIFPNLHTKLP